MVCKACASRPKNICNFPQLRQRLSNLNTLISFEVRRFFENCRLEYMCTVIVGRLSAPDRTDGCDDGSDLKSQLGCRHLASVPDRILAVQFIFPAAEKHFACSPGPAFRNPPWDPWIPNHTILSSSLSTVSRFIDVPEETFLDSVVLSARIVCAQRERSSPRSIKVEGSTRFVAETVAIGPKLWASGRSRPEKIMAFRSSPASSVDPSNISLMTRQ